MTAGRPAAPQAARAALPIDPRIRQRRVAVTREEGRRRLSILLSVLGVTALGAVAVGIAHSPFLSVNQVQVVGAKATDPADVVQAAGLDRRPLMIHVDGGLVDRRVGRLSWIATVHTERHWPSTVRLVVTERAPVAQHAEAPPRERELNTPSTIDVVPLVQRAVHMHGMPQSRKIPVEKSPPHS